MINDDQSEQLRPARILPRKWDIFFSYAREDAEIATALLSCLERRSFSVWSEARMTPSDPLSAIEHALKRSGVAVFLVSKPYLSSRWLRHEMGNAIRTLSPRRFYPIVVGDIDLLTFPDWPVDYRWLHLDSRRNVERLVERIQPSIEKALGSRTGLSARAEIVGELPRRAPLVGIDEYLKLLLARRTGITALIGVAGSGKTSLAAEYAYATRDEMDFIAWFSAWSLQSSDINSRLARLTARANRGQYGLVVIDEWHSIDERHSKEAARAEFVRSLIALAQNNRVILTARDVGTIHPFRGSNCALMMLEDLHPSAIADYLSFYSPESRSYSAEEIHRIAEITGGLPIAVRLMAKALKERSVDEILRRSEESEERIEPVLDAALAPLPPNRRHRLHVLSFCPRLLSMVWSDEEWKLSGDEELLSYLLDCGLIVRTAVEKVMMPAPIVRFLRMSAPRTALEDSISYVIERLPDPDNSTSRALLSTVTELADIAKWDFARIPPSDIAELLLWQASAWRLTIGPERAQKVCDQALSLAKQSDQPLLHVRAMNLQSTLAFECGRIQEASAIGHEAAELALSSFGSEHPVSLATVGNLASALRAQGELPAAIMLLRRVMGSMAEDHPDRLAVQINLAICLREGGFITEALESLTSARQSLNDTTNSRVRLQIDQNMAAILLELGRAEEALHLLTGSLQCIEDDRPWDSVEKLEVQTNLALTYASLEMFDEALKTQAQAVDNSEIFCGPDHLSTMNALHSYALLLLRAQRAEEAAAVLTEVAERRIRVLGPDHPDTLQTQLLKAHALRQLDKPKEALEKLKALSLDFERILGKEHSMSFAVREEIAELFDQLHESHRSRTAYRQLLTDLERVLPAQHPMVKRVKQKSGLASPTSFQGLWNIVNNPTTSWGSVK